MFVIRVLPKAAVQNHRAAEISVSTIRYVQDRRESEPRDEARFLYSIILIVYLSFELYSRSLSLPKYSSKYFLLFCLVTRISTSR